MFIDNYSAVGSVGNGFETGIADPDENNIMVDVGKTLENYERNPLSIQTLGRK